MSDEEPDIDIAKLLKDVELFGASTWKERKQIENRKVVELGGKAMTKHRTPLSVAKPAMKNQLKREQRKVEEERLLGIFRKRDTKNGKAQKTRPEDRVLRATEGRFKNGILDRGSDVEEATPGVRFAERCADARAAGELGRALSEAEAYASKEKVRHNRFLSPRALREHIKNIEKETDASLGSTACLRMPLWVQLLILLPVASEVTQIHR